MEHSSGVFIRVVWVMTAIDLPRSDSVEAGDTISLCTVLTEVEAGKGGGGGSSMGSWSPVSPHGGAAAVILGGSGVDRPK